MNLLIKLAAALLPAILLLIYIYWRDPQKEPTKALIRAVLLGAFLCVPVAFLESFIESLLFDKGVSLSLAGTTVKAFMVAALPEEAAKLFVLWLIARTNRHFDEHFDGIVYAVYISLGFAAIENIFSVLGSENWLSVAFGRALLSVPGHYAFAVIMGYCYSIYRFVQPSVKNAVFVLLMPVMAHGIYDALAMSGEANPYAGSIGFFILIYFCIKMHKIAGQRIDTLIMKDRESSYQ